jgi:HAD superfamily hydrolase (TIGR01509 family)
LKYHEMLYNTVIFDFFGVICSEVAPFWLVRHMSENDAGLVKGSVVLAADVGKISQAEMFAKLFEITGVPPPRIESEWYELARIDERAVGVVRRLTRRCALGLLTNSPAPFVRGLLERYDLESLFDCIVISSEAGVAKPSRDIYELLISKMNAVRETSLMIDDNPKNVEGALAVGMHGMLFRSAEQLEALLLA